MPIPVYQVFMKRAREKNISLVLLNALSDQVDFDGSNRIRLHRELMDHVGIDSNSLDKTDKSVVFVGIQESIRLFSQAGFKKWWADLLNQELENVNAAMAPGDYVYGQ
jgi:DNA-binding transcriptional regulator/RsmH inhibitor MraZ